jgi:hypothetical protein
MSEDPVDLKTQVSGNPVIDRIETWLGVQDPAEQIDSIIRREDAEETLQSMDAPVLYRLIKRAGWDQAYDLLQYVTPEQLQVFIDFDCWQRDRLQTETLQKWLSALVAEADDEQFKTVCRELDPEILPIFFKTHLKVEQTDDENQPPEEWEGEVEVTPDGWYAIKYPEDDEDAGRLIRMILDRLYYVDRTLAWTLLEAVRWELMANMEEEAYRWRNSRLEEFGFVPREQAVEVYAFRSPVQYRESIEEKDKGDQARRVEPPARLDVPAVVRDEFDDEFFVYRVMRAITDDEDLRRILYQMRTLMNRTIVADGIEPGNLELGREVVRRTLGYLSLGLEFLARGKDEKAAGYLRDLPTKEIFQTGYSLTAKLQKKVQEMRDRPTLTLVDSDDYSLLGADDRALVESLLRTRPTYAADANTYDIFKSQEQLDDAAFRVGTIAFKQMWLFGIQEQDVGELAELIYSDETMNAPDEVTFETLFATRLVNFFADDVDGPLAPLDPVKLRDLPELMRRAPWGEDPVDYLSDDLISPIVDAAPVATRNLVVKWVRETMSTLREEFAGIREVDEPKYVTSVVLVRH